jgi:hypothetical protein
LSDAASPYVAAGSSTSAFRRTSAQTRGAPTLTSSSGQESATSASAATRSRASAVHRFAVAASFTASRAASTTWRAKLSLRLAERSSSWGRCSPWVTANWAAWRARRRASGLPSNDRCPKSQAKDTSRSSGQADT